MGRKRTSNKVKLGLSVDKDIKEKLLKYEINMSALFAEAAVKKIAEVESIVDIPEGVK